MLAAGQAGPDGVEDGREIAMVFRGAAQGGRHLGCVEEQGGIPAGSRTLQLPGWS